MDSELIYAIPIGIFMLAFFIRQPVVDYRPKIKERRMNARRDDQRTTRFRRQECEECDSEEQRASENDRRDVTQEKRRRDRRALERIKRL